MRLEEIVRIGEIMELNIDGKTYKTKLQDMHEDDAFSVLYPTEKGVLVPLTQEDIINIRFYRESGIFEFDARMRSRFDKGTLKLCMLEVISDIKRSQRRQSYRLPIVLPVLIWRLDDEEQKKYKAKTVDISEHGILLTCFESIPKGTKVCAEIKMTDTEKRVFESEVLRCEQPFNKNEPQKMVLIYVNISESDRNYLGRYIMRQQITARKKGKSGK